MSRPNTSLRLQVADARLEDVGEDRARVSSDLLASLQAAEGDPLILRGRRELHARIASAGPEDDGLGIVRLDGGQRHRLGVELGATIEAEVRQPVAASRVRLVLLGRDSDHAIAQEHLHQSLDGHSVSTGDTVTVMPDRRHFEAEVSVLGLSIAGVSGTSTDADGVLARIVTTEPHGLVRVDEHTRIEIDETGAEEDRGHVAADA